MKHMVSSEPQPRSWVVRMQGLVGRSPRKEAKGHKTGDIVAFAYGCGGDWRICLY